MTRARGGGLRRVGTPASITWTSDSGVIGELQPDDQNSVLLYDELDDVKCTTASGGLMVVPSCEWEAILEAVRAMRMITMLMRTWMISTA